MSEKTLKDALGAVQSVLVLGGGSDIALATVRKLIEAIFPPPAKGLEVLPAEHVVYKSFYLLDKPLGRLAIAPAMEGVIRDDRLVCAYVPNDLGALAGEGLVEIGRASCRERV